MNARDFFYLYCGCLGARCCRALEWREHVGNLKPISHTLLPVLVSRVLTRTLRQNSVLKRDLILVCTIIFGSVKSSQSQALAKRVQYAFSLKIGARGADSGSQNADLASDIMLTPLLEGSRYAFGYGSG